jgi:hypothetical protein
MEPNKTFTIAGREFVFKDLTINEAEEVKDLTAKANISDKEVSLNYTSQETKRFLFLVLKPADNKPLEETFFGDALEKDFAEVFLTFFLARMNWAKISATQFAMSMLNLIELSKNSEA